MSDSAFNRVHGFISMWGSSDAAEDWLKAAEPEYKRRYAQMRAQQTQSRIDSVLAAARASETIDGTKCTRATRAKIQRLIAMHEAWSDDMLPAIACRWVQKGMTAEQLRASWGGPEDINRTVTSFGVSEQWVYGDSYVYLDEGVVTAWQN
jgi:hypothetical protein